MMAKAIPMAKAQPIWKREPYTARGSGELTFRKREEVAAMPGKLRKEQCERQSRYC